MKASAPAGRRVGRLAQRADAADREADAPDGHGEDDREDDEQEAWQTSGHAVEEDHEAFRSGTGGSASSARGRRASAGRPAGASSVAGGCQHRGPVEAGAEGRGRGAANAQVLERGDDALRRVAVAVGVRRARHAGVRGRIGQQRLAARDDAVGIGADERQRAGLDALAALGGLARHEHGLAERGRLLLDAAGVGDHEVAAREQPRELAVRCGSVSRTFSRASSSGSERRPHAGLGCSGSTNETSGCVGREARHRLADPPQAVAPVLAAVRRDQHEAAVAVVHRGHAGSLKGMSRPEAQYSASIPVLPVT